MWVAHESPGFILQVLFQHVRSRTEHLRGRVKGAFLELQTADNGSRFHRDGVQESAKGRCDPDIHRVVIHFGHTLEGNGIQDV